MKGIVLAGGSGTRLYPVTKSISKQLLPIFDKPMIYYSISVLMMAGIKEILIISTPNDIDSFKKLLGNGNDLGLSFSYVVQPFPDGLAQAFILGEEFIGSDSVSLILGDNIFFGYNFSSILQNSVQKINGAVIFGYYVSDPERYGIVEFDEDKNAISIEEKPKNPKSHYAVTGLYFYDNTVVEKAKQVKPSKRGELEITDLNNLYLSEGRLTVEQFGRGMAWLDTGTHHSLLQASNFVESIQDRQGLKIACLEEIAFKMGYINKQQLIELAKPLLKNNYGEYLIQIADESKTNNI